MTHTLPPLLLGLFRELKANGVPVGVRDYLDGIEALRLGFGQDDRAALRDLAIALWSRSDEERRVINRWFDVLPAPDDALAAAIDDQLDRLDTTAPEHTGAPTAPASRPPAQPGAGTTPAPANPALPPPAA